MDTMLSERKMGMNGQATEQAAPKSPSAKSFGGLNNIISKLINQKTKDDPENVIHNTPGTSTESSPVKLSTDTVYKCPMKSCETKVTLSNVEKHLTSSHPDVFILFKRILMNKYNLSAEACKECGFHFQSSEQYGAHLGFKCQNFRSRQVSSQLENYLVNQCRDALVEFDGEEETLVEETIVAEDTEEYIEIIPNLATDGDWEAENVKKTAKAERFQCPVKNCIESASEISTMLRHIESCHKAESYFFRTRFNCPQLQSRCVSCQYSFPSESYLQNHDCRGYQVASFHDDKVIDNIVSDSLEVEVDSALEEAVNDAVEEQGLTKLRGFKCPIKVCTMKTERLAGILRHLFTRHGYEGLVFRLSTDVWGMSERCNDCGFHFDHLSNSLYKHKYDKACEKNIQRKKELEAEYAADQNKRPIVDILASIDFESFKERVLVDSEGRSTSKEVSNTTKDTSSSNSGFFNQPSYSLSSMVNGFGKPAAGNSIVPHDYHKPKFSRDFMSPYSSSTDLIYRCPVIECGKAFSKLGGIFKHLVPAHGYQGVLFRMEHNVAGLNMICGICKWNYADKNAIYKHRHLNTCVSNIRITSEQKLKYELDPNRKSLADLRAEINFQVLADLNRHSVDSFSQVTNEFHHTSLSEKLKNALSGLSNGVSIKISDEPLKNNTDSIALKTDDINVDVEANLKNTLDVLNNVSNIENLTPEQAADILKLFQQTTTPGNGSNGHSHGLGLDLGIEEAQVETFNQCPAWGCKRKFTSFTHGGKSNISSLWIHMQNAHRAAFVVFRRLKRPGFDKYCEKCRFWLKGAEWYNHRNLRRYQSEGNRPEGTYCDVYQRLAQDLQKLDSPLHLLNIRMCMEQYNCDVPDGDHLAAEQAMQEDNLNFGIENYLDSLPSMVDINGTESPTFTFNRPLYSPPRELSPPSIARTEPISQKLSLPGGIQLPAITAVETVVNATVSPIKIDIEPIAKTESPTVIELNPCPVKLCGKQFQKSETSEGKNLFTHMKANHPNAYIIFRRLERSLTKKRCTECLFWFNNYRDYGAHNQQTGNKRDDSFKGTYCEQYQKMAINHLKVTNCYELGKDEELDLTILENVFKCKIPFEMNYNDNNLESLNEMKMDDITTSFDALIPESFPTSSTHANPPVPQVNTLPNEADTVTYINDDEDQPIHPLHKPHEGSYVCPVKACSQVIKTMKGVLGHMRIKHKREYVIFRRTKMATAHRKCDECEFWFQSAKTYHQHRSQLPNQLPGENKGSECDAYVRIANQFTKHELGDMSNFVKELFKFYLESKHQDKPANRKKMTPNGIQNSYNGLFGQSQNSESSFGELSFFTGATVLNPDALNLFQQSMVSGNPVPIERDIGFKPVPIPVNQNQLIECPVFDCKLKIKFSSLNIHFSRKHSAAFYHFKRSDFDIFTIRCSQCGFGYYNHLHFQHSHRDCAHQTKSKYLEKTTEEEFEMAQNSFSLSLKVIDEIGSPDKSRETPSPSSKYLQAKNQLTDFQLKISSLDGDGEVNDNMQVTCVDKHCQFSGQLRTLIPHLSEKHPYLNVEFRSRKSELFEYKCESCQYYFHSRNLMYSHRLSGQCLRNKSNLVQYRAFLEKVGKIGQEQVLRNMRESIKITELPGLNHKRKSFQTLDESFSKRIKVEEPRLIETESWNDTYVEDVSETNFESFESETSPTKALNKPLEVEMESRSTHLFDKMHTHQKNDEYSCDYCSNNVSFPIFNLLVAHLKNEHANKYIQFRIKKTAQVPFRCQHCNFCFPDEKTYNRHIAKKICDKNLKLFEEYTQSLENDDDDDDDSGDESME